MRIRTIVLPILVFLTSINVGASAEFESEVIKRSYKHDKFGTEPKDLIYPSRAYVTSYDSEDDDDGDGVADMRGIPEWVSYEMRRYRGKLPRAPARPGTWITVGELFDAGIAPRDATYAYSSAFRRRHPNWYVRGHLCMKQHAWRLGAAADWNTHTVLNAVPQRSDFNSGIWQDLEKLTAKWADNYGVVWIIVGPIFDDRQPTAFLGEKGELKIAIPDALFKIVIKESSDGNRPDVLGFVYPQRGKRYRRGPFNHDNFLKSVREIERRTGLTFLNNLPAADQSAIKEVVATELWQ